MGKIEKYIIYSSENKALKIDQKNIEKHPLTYYFR